MDFSNFLMMHQELGLLSIFVILLFFDILASGTRYMRWFRAVAVGLLSLQTIFGFFPIPVGAAFGVMYVTRALPFLSQT